VRRCGRGRPRGRDDGLEHAFEFVAGPHRAFAIICVVEQSSLGRPGEDHRLATEPDAIGGCAASSAAVSNVCLEAVHVDQDVSSAAGLREEIADISDNTGSTPSRCQSPSPAAAREKRLSSGGDSFASATVIVEARSGPTTASPAAFTGLRVVVTSSVGH